MKLGNLLEMPIRIYEKRSKIPGSIFRKYIFLRKKLDGNWPKKFDIEKYIYVNSIVDEEIKNNDSKKNKYYNIVNFNEFNENELFMLIQQDKIK